MKRGKAKYNNYGLPVYDANKHEVDWAVLVGLILVCAAVGAVTVIRELGLLVVALMVLASFSATHSIVWVVKKGIRKFWQ